MPVNSYITDPRNSNMAYVDISEGEPNALVVATRPLKELTPIDIPFLNDTYGVDMNQNAAFSGNPEEVHDGTDNAYWTATTISSNWTFDSTDQNHTTIGTKSIKGKDTDNGTCQIAKGSNLDLNGYVALTGWVYIEGWKNDEDVLIYGWEVGVGIVGVSVDIGAYVSITTKNVWQQYVIPLIDMALTTSTIDAIRVESIRKPNFYLDDIQFEELGTPLIYEVIPEPGTWYRVKALSVMVRDNVSTILQYNSMPNISYDDYLGVTVTKPVVYQRVTLEEPISATFIGLGDWLILPNTFIASSMCDGTNTQITIQFNFNSPVLLKSEEQEKLRMIIADNFSGLLDFQVWATGTVEDRRDIT